MCVSSNASFFCEKALSQKTALVWYIIDLSFHLPHKSTIIRYMFAIIAALAWFLPSVCSQITWNMCKITILWEILLAMAIIIWMFRWIIKPSLYSKPSQYISMEIVSHQRIYSHVVSRWLDNYSVRYICKNSHIYKVYIQYLLLCSS